MTVLVLTAPDDCTADCVCAALDVRATAWIRMDLADFPDNLSLVTDGPGPGWSGYLVHRGRKIRLDDISAVYYRRPGPFGVPGEMCPRDRRFAVAETRQGLGGVLTCLSARYVNHPARIADLCFSGARPVR